MSQWKDNLKNHKAFRLASDVLKVVEEADPFDSELEADLVTRLKLVLQRTIKILEAADLTYVSAEGLNSIRSNLVQINSNFETLKANRNNPEAQSPQRGEIETHIDSMLLTLGQIRAVAYPINKESVMEKLGNLKLDSAKEAQNIRAVFREELTELTEDMKTAKEDAAQLQTSIADEKLRIDNLVSQSQAEFNEGQKARDNEFADKLKKDYGPKVSAKVKEIDSALSSFDEIGKASLDSYDDKAKQSLTKLDGHTERAGLVAQSIAQKALKTTYETTATAEANEARKWSFFTLGVSGAMVLYVVAILVQIILQEKPFSPESIAPKVLLTAILVGIARWTAKLERRHSDEARKYKQLSLELETIAPFIATLESTDQQAITKELVPRYFVGRTVKREDLTEDGDSFAHPVQSITEMSKKILETKSE